VSALSKRAAEVERELGAEWTRYHVGAQVSRFLVGMLAAALWSIHSGFGDWTDLVPLLGTAAWTTAAQMWPQVPWSLLREHLGVVKPPAPPTAPPPPKG
jgi:hypothetical protein